MQKKLYLGIFLFLSISSGISASKFDEFFLSVISANKGDILYELSSVDKEIKKEETMSRIDKAFQDVYLIGKIRAQFPKTSLNSLKNDRLELIKKLEQIDQTVTS